MYAGHWNGIADSAVCAVISYTDETFRKPLLRKDMPPSIDRKQSNERQPLQSDLITKSGDFREDLTAIEEAEATLRAKAKKVYGDQYSKKMKFEVCTNARGLFKKNELFLREKKTANSTFSRNNWQSYQGTRWLRTQLKENFPSRGFWARRYDNESDFSPDKVLYEQRQAVLDDVDKKTDGRFDTSIVRQVKKRG